MGIEKTITVRAGRQYEIAIGRGILPLAGEKLRKVSGASKAAVVTDSNVGPLYEETVVKSLRAAGFETAVHRFPAGEASKCHACLLDIYGFLADFGITRSDIVVALGGGVCGDMAGFAAATFMRGVGIIQIPTTLLAAIDSSVGGKTAVDLPQGKNLVGAFWQPRLVLCDADTLKTLPDKVFRDGMAEAIKYGCIKDKKLFELIADGGIKDEKLLEMIACCVDIKRGVVERDERESGERMLLNFGHTLGHSVEKLFEYETYTHGEAVAMGMAAAARAGEKNGDTAPGTADLVEAALKVYGLPTQLPKPVAELAAAARSDKKCSGDNLNFILLKRIGESFIRKMPFADFEQYVSELK